jgi:hypothetical protein
MGSSSNKLAALSLWIVAGSVAIALLGSSTLLFPGPDVGGQTTSPPGRDVVARVVAQILGPAQTQRRTPPPPPALEPSTAVPSSPESVLAAATPAAAAEGPVTAPSRSVPSKPRTDAVPTTPRKDKATKPQRGKGGAGATSQGHGVADATSQGHGVAGAKSQGHGVAGAKSQGHGVAGAKSKGDGRLKFDPPRGPKSHVRPAKGKGKAAGHSRAHARAGR